MASKNVETLRAAHESWNRRDFPGVIRTSIEDLVYNDHRTHHAQAGPQRIDREIEQVPIAKAEK